MFNRTEVILHKNLQDPKGLSLQNKIKKWNPALAEKIKSIRVVDLFWSQFEGEQKEFEAAAQDVWWDAITQQKDLPGSDWIVEREYHPGMTDNLGRTGHEALEICCQRPLEESAVTSGQLYLFTGAELHREEISKITETFISNSLIHRHRIFDHVEFAKHLRFESSEIAPKFTPPKLAATAALMIPISTMNETQLKELSQKNLLSLNLNEMLAIQSYFKSEKREPTDVEIEILAQTWSEHCKHKIFAADVEYTEETTHKVGIPNKIAGLFKTTIAGTTKELPKPWLLSVFKDNAGIVAFSDDDALCIKVETHNSPSALDPFGGAITGIVGVNRDILGCGFGAKPIFNTDVFCVGPLEMTNNLPAGIIPPIQLLEGIRSGVEAGGNQSGIPTVNGALYFDPSFVGKPLVFCGSGGIMPRKIAEKQCFEKEIRAQDLICMVGGRIGRDGIHGATFSSLEMTESIPSSVVQLGDPITQRRMTDFLIEARDLGMYRTLTDNGAGGLSSSVGEMADLAGGARMDVRLAKTKMPGLKPFELVISESQERMTVAVPPEDKDKFLELAHRRGVEVSVLGEFNKSRRFEVFYGSDKVADLSLEFLHEGCPTLKLKGHWKEKSFAAKSTAQEVRPFQTLKALLQRPNIRSKENLIRQYDHEVQGRSVIKSLQTSKKQRSTPNDAAVLAVSLDNNLGVVVGCGLAPRMSQADPYIMAQMAVDESVRNLLSVGAEFSLGDDTVLSLIDNFCWPDPVEDAEKMAALVRTCYGLRKACLALKAPLISGKDSMKNDYKGTKNGEPVKVSVLPTLLVTAMGRMPDYRMARSADFKVAGDKVYRLGPQQNGLAQSEWHGLRAELSQNTLTVPQPDWDSALPIYEWLGSKESAGLLRSCHDVSEGGLFVALAESCFTNNLGLTIHSQFNAQDANVAFGEGFHQFVVSIAADKAASVEAFWKNQNMAYTEIGIVTENPEWKWQTEKISVDDLYQAWSGEAL
ncbi:MAG: phosphoribosylformylglycinamidine synthase [Bdellovibrionaceae bacterium]|nr:phosphoribosylformylglycinamidine synthase [Pseudobdellovibrionaceae bacterium]